MYLILSMGILFTHP